MVGSNIFNLGLIAGLVAVVADVPIRGNVIKLEYPVMLLATVGFLLLATDGVFDGYEASVFLLALVIFTGWSVRIAREDVEPVEVAQLEAEVKWRVLHPRHRAMLLVRPGGPGRARSPRAGRQAPG